MEELGLTPPLTGLLRAVAQGPGRSRQAIAGTRGRTRSDGTPHGREA